MHYIIKLFLIKDVNLNRIELLMRPKTVNYFIPCVTYAVNEFAQLTGRPPISEWLQVLIISDPKYNTKWANDVWGFPLLSESIFWNKWAAETGNEEKKINGDCIVSGKLEKIPNQIT